MYITEVGTHAKPEFRKLEYHITQIKKSRNKTDRSTGIINLEKQLTKIFKCPFDIEIIHMGDLSYNVSVLPIFNDVGQLKININDLNFSAIKSVKLLIGYEILDEVSSPGIVAIIFHEMGHIAVYANMSDLYVKNFEYYLEQLKMPALIVGLLTGFLLPLYVIVGRTLTWTSHYGEYGADKFATSCGYGDELIKVFHTWRIKHTFLGENSTNRLIRVLSSALKLFNFSSHPTDRDRISNMINDIILNYSKEYNSKYLAKILKYYSLEKK